MVAASLALILTAISCQHREHPLARRLAVVPFENLTGDPSLDWAGPAVAGIFVAGASGSATVFPMLLANARDAVQAQASSVVRGYFERRGAQLRFYASIEDTASHRTVKTVEASGPVSSVTAIAGYLEKQTTGASRPFATQTPDAIRDWGESLLAVDVSSRASALDKAIQADRNFGAAYAGLAGLLLSAGDRNGAARVVALARARIAQFNEVDRAQVGLIDASLKGDAEARRKSLVELSRLIPGDPQNFASLGDVALSRRDFNAASDNYKRALLLLPDSVELLNQLGYVEAYRGRVDGARAALERYRSLQPDEWNPLDSLGETSYIGGHFAEAEKYFLDADSRAPGMGGREILKAAQARLMQDNVAGAGELFQKYIGPRLASHDPRAAMERAQWLYLTGRHNEAFAMLESAASLPGDAGAFATAQLSLWKLNAQDRAGAISLADRAAQNAASPSMRTFANLCQSIAGSQAASGQPILNPEFRLIQLGYGLLNGKNAALGSRGELKDLFEKTPPSADGPIRTLYAWSLVDSGQAGQAAPLVEVYFPPFSSLNNPLNSLVFPRFLAVRAAVREQQGHKDEAISLNDLYKKLAGPGLR